MLYLPADTPTPWGIYRSGTKAHLLATLDDGRRIVCLDGTHHLTSTCHSATLYPKNYRHRPRPEADTKDVMPAPRLQHRIVSLPEGVTVREGDDEAEPLAWQAHAGCAVYPNNDLHTAAAVRIDLLARIRERDEAFFPYRREGGAPGKPDPYREARRICRDCPVRAECLKVALDAEVAGPRWGMYGGLNPTERAELVAQQRAERFGLTKGTPRR